jgi:hypothetical protein
MSLQMIMIDVYFQYGDHRHLSRIWLNYEDTQDPHLAQCSVYACGTSAIGTRVS